MNFDPTILQTYEKHVIVFLSRIFKLHLIIMTKTNINEKQWKGTSKIYKRYKAIILMCEEPTSQITGFELTLGYKTKELNALTNSRSYINM